MRTNHQLAQSKYNVLLAQIPIKTACLTLIRVSYMATMVLGKVAIWEWTVTESGFSSSRESTHTTTRQTQNESMERQEDTYLSTRPSFRAASVCFRVRDLRSSSPNAPSRMRELPQELFSKGECALPCASAPRCARVAQGYAFFRRWGPTSKCIPFLCIKNVVACRACLFLVSAAAKLKCASSTECRFFEYICL